MTHSHSSADRPAAKSEENNNLKHLLDTHQLLAQITADLERILKSMQGSHSLITKAALFWDTLPVWQKISLGLLLFVPAFILGVTIHLAVLITLSLCVLIGYIASFVLLDNHAQHQGAQIEELQVGIARLGALLVLMIEQLALLKERLALELDALHQKIDELSEQIKLLRTQNEQLTEETTQLNEAAQRLHAVNQTLEATATQLQTLTTEQAQHLGELEHLIIQHERTQLDLSVHILALNEEKTTRGLELERLRKVVVELQTLTKQLTAFSFKSKEQQEQFIQQLHDFSQQKEQKLGQLVDELTQHTDDLSLQKDELKSTAAHLKELSLEYESLIGRHEQLVRQLEARENHPPAQSKDTAIPLTQIGVFARNRAHCEPSTQEAGNEWKRALQTN